MREDLNREKMHKAIDSSFSGLNGDPWLFQRVSARAAEGEIHMKKKLSAGLILALVLILLAAVALAVTLLTHKEIVEQVAVPLALENDAETVGVNDFYSAEELAEIVRALNKNGITLEENNRVMQCIANGRGWYENDVINEICSQAFGSDYYTWTPEQIKWYEDLKYKLGHVEAGWTVSVPGENNMTCEEAESFALSKLRAVYGQDLPLEDRNIWELSSCFIKGNQKKTEDSWAFWLTPKDLEHGNYSIYFNDRNPAESAETKADIPDWTKPYTSERLEEQFWDAYGWNEGDWPQSVWQKYHEMLLNAELDPERGMYSTYVGYQLTNYPDPLPSDISREEAVRIAKEALGLEQAVFDSAVLVEYEGERSWLVGFETREWIDFPEDIEMEHFVISIDPVSGSVLSQRKAESDDRHSMAYIAEKAYYKARGYTMSPADAIPLAMEAIREKYPRLDPADINEYAVNDFFSTGEYVRFDTRNPKHGGISVWFNPDGTVESVGKDRGWSSLTGDNLLSRYTEAYGAMCDWDQSRWVQLDRDMESLTPKLIEGTILKSTHYPEESSVTIQSRQAQELGVQASGLRTGEPGFCVLVAAQPHPVWILSIVSWGADNNQIIGIDAETGEHVFTEQNISEITPFYARYSLPEIWRKLELEMKGAPYVAKNAIICQFTDPSKWLPDYDSMEDGFNWDLEVDGLTVRYTGRWKGMKSYEVELDEKGNVLRCEETESEATEERPKEEIWEQPWIWKSTAAPDTYWKQLETVLAKNEVDADFGNLPNKLVEWTEQYGAFSRETWPSDLYAIGYVLTKIRPSDLAAGTATFPEISETK